MTCTVVTKPDGTRMMVCRRGERRPMVDREPLAIVPPASPWQLGRRVRHARYGDGTITTRNAEAIRVAFDGGHAGVFMLAFVGKAMEVLP